ncbi:hypothetical protein C8R47DRAFT_1201991 [Mycena vitilis]|nr:hypothetical protein C8R47DRAFT_1201991 [Mycena vitilis]
MYQNPIYAWRMLDWVANSTVDPISQELHMERSFLLLSPVPSECIAWRAEGVRVCRFYFQPRWESANALLDWKCGGFTVDWAGIAIAGYFKPDANLNQPAEFRTLIRVVPRSSNNPNKCEDTFSTSLRHFPNWIHRLRRTDELESDACARSCEFDLAPLFCVNGNIVNVLPPLGECGPTWRKACSIFLVKVDTSTVSGAPRDEMELISTCLAPARAVPGGSKVQVRMNEYCAALDIQLTTSRKACSTFRREVDIRTAPIGLRFPRRNYVSKHSYRKPTVKMNPFLYNPVFIQILLSALFLVLSIYSICTPTVHIEHASREIPHRCCKINPDNKGNDEQLLSRWAATGGGDQIQLSCDAHARQGRGCVVLNFKATVHVTLQDTQSPPQTIQHKLFMAAGRARPHGNKLTYVASILGNGDQPGESRQPCAPPVKLEHLDKKQANPKIPPPQTQLPREKKNLKKPPGTTVLRVVHSRDMRCEVLAPEESGSAA